MSKKLKSRGWLLGKPRVYNHAISDSTGSLVIGSDIEELLQLEILCKELRDERDRLQTSLLMEQSKNCQVIKSREAEVDELNKTWEKDKKRSENLDLELKSLSDHIGHFQEEEEMKNVEANLVAGYIQNLDMNLAGSDKLHEKINHLREELAKSEVDRLGLKQELEDKNNMLQDTVDCMNRLEEHISTNSMKYEHEMQIMRQELVMSEQRCIIAKNDCEQAAKEVKQKVSLIKNLKDQLEKAQQSIRCLQKGLKFQKYLEMPEVKVTDFCHNLQKHFDQWLSRENAMKHDITLESDNNVAIVEGNQLLLDKESSNTRSDEDLELLFSKLVIIKNMEEKSQEDVGSMSQQLSQLQATVSELKDELREEKKKAKEEAEDMTQEMAELRYQLMEMLEQERELRAHTEQASLHRVEELEAQRDEETKKTLIAIEHCHKAEKVAEAEAKEVERLKLSLDGLKQVEEQLRNSQNREAHLQAKCSELESQVEFLHEKLGAAEQEIQAVNEHHVEALLEYEEEYSWMKAEADAAKKSLAGQLAQLDKSMAEKTALLDAFQDILAKPLTPTKNERHGHLVKEPEVTLERREENLKDERQFHTETQHKLTDMQSFLEEALCKLAVANAELDSARKEIERLLLNQHETEKQLLVHVKEIDGKEVSIKKLQDTVLEKEKLLYLQNEELRSQATENKKLLNRVAALVSEVQSLQQSLLSSHSVIEELKFQLQNTQEAASVERRRASKLEDDARCKSEKIARQNEMLVQSQLKFNNLHKKFTSLQAELNNSQRKEKEALSLVESLNLELTVAKEEVVSSEVRMQKVLKQAKEQLDSERRRYGELISSYKQAEWFMNRQVANDRKNRGSEVVGSSQM